VIGICPLGQQKSGGSQVIGQNRVNQRRAPIGSRVIDVCAVMKQSQFDLRYASYLPLL